MQFLRSIWKILHLTEYFYTGTARGARNNYQVCITITITITKIISGIFIITSGPPTLLLQTADPLHDRHETKSEYI